MATITKTPSNTWKALVRRRGWPTAIKTFRTRRDAQDWARRVEDDMVRGAYIDRAPSEKTTLRSALTRYLGEISPTKSAGTKRRETGRAKPLLEKLGDYSLVAITPDLVAGYRDERVEVGKSNNTVRLELALLSHLFTVAMKEWQMGLLYNPVAAVRKPAAGAGRYRRLIDDEEARLLKACDEATNPMLGCPGPAKVYSDACAAIDWTMPALAGIFTPLLLQDLLLMYIEAHRKLSTPTDVANAETCRNALVMLRVSDQRSAGASDPHDNAHQGEWEHHSRRPPARADTRTAHRAAISRAVRIEDAHTPAINHDRPHAVSCH